MKNGILLLILLFGASLQGCHEKSRATQHTGQGIKGQVFWEEGNRMPKVDEKMSPKEGIQRMIYVYKLTKPSETIVDNGYFHRDIQTPFVKKFSTGKDGKFREDLPPGRYSLFVKEKDGMFANYLDGEGYLQPVTVKAGEYSELEIVVNYKAYY